MRQVLIYRGEDGFWVAECPSLPGCVSQGENAGHRACQADDIPVPEENFNARLLTV